MRYWEEDPSFGGHMEVVEKRVTKETVKNTLETIKRGYLPDWNYEEHRSGGKDLSLPNENYPLHMAMLAALKAVEAMDDGFFGELDKECGKKEG